jgi:hypothetical protein
MSSVAVFKAKICEFPIIFLWVTHLRRKYEKFNQLDIGLLRG